MELRCDLSKKLAFSWLVEASAYMIIKLTSPYVCIDANRINLACFNRTTRINSVCQT